MKRPSQQARGGPAGGETRHQALSPGDDRRIGVRRERTGVICTPSVRNSAESPAPHGRTSIVNSQPRYRPAEDSECSTLTAASRHADRAVARRDEAALTELVVD